MRALVLLSGFWGGSMLGCLVFDGVLMTPGLFQANLYASVAFALGYSARRPISDM